MNGKHFPSINQSINHFDVLPEPLVRPQKHNVKKQLTQYKKLKLIEQEPSQILIITINYSFWLNYGKINAH